VRHDLILLYKRPLAFISCLAGGKVEGVGGGGKKGENEKKITQKREDNE
jgi:hypothetical protein